MEPNELKIGNLISYKGEVREVEGIQIITTPTNKYSCTHVHLKYEYQKRVLVKLEDVQPIPLTKDWFDKFGMTEYECEDEAWGYRKNSFIFINEYHIRTTLMPDDALISVSEWTGFTSETALIIQEEKAGIDHVHQLQNIYSSLTQEELTLKALVNEQ